MKKKRFNPQKNITSPSSRQEEIPESHPVSHKKEKHFETVVKNISHTYHTQKKGNTFKNTLFFGIFSLFLLSTAAWALPRVLSFQFDSLGSFFSQVNPAEVFAPENKEMNVLIL